MNLTTMKSGVIAVGAGHAGIEASLAAARMGVPTMMLTLNLDHIGQMSCNPGDRRDSAQGNHLVREIDALGVAKMALAIDATRPGIQFRFLNTRKGPAVRARRAQADKAAYRARMKRVLEITPNLTIRQASVERLLLEGGRVRGVESQIGEIFEADCVILTTWATFLKAWSISDSENYSSRARAGDFTPRDGFERASGGTRLPHRTAEDRHYFHAWTAAVSTTPNSRCSRATIRRRRSRSGRRGSNRIRSRVISPTPTR